MEEIRLTTVPTGLDAEMLCGRLRLEGIRCHYRLANAGAGLTGGMLASGPQEVIVDAADLERARELLETGPG